MQLSIPYQLKPSRISRLPTKAKGVYVFGTFRLNRKTKRKKFKIKYVGRSDTNLAKEILDQFNKKTNAGFKYTHFKFLKLNTDRQSFKAECELYHKHGKAKELDNIIHPRVPKGAPKGYKKCTEVGCNGER